MSLLGDVLEAADTKADPSEEIDLTAFRIVDPDPDESEFRHRVLAVGVVLPWRGVYVDWHTAAWPEDGQLDGPHVSEYDTLEDVETVTEGEVEVLHTMDMIDDYAESDSKAEPGRAALSPGGDSE